MNLINKFISYDIKCKNKNKMKLLIDFKVSRIQLK